MWLGSHISDPAALDYARANQITDKDGAILDGTAYYCSPTDSVRVWTRKSGWRNIMFYREGTVPCAFDPASGELLALFGSVWRPVRVKPTP